MKKPTIILYDIENLPFGTQVRIILNNTDSMEAISFGDKFGLQNGEVKTAAEISEADWQVVLGWK